jgi:hypothetical protein
MLCFYYLLCCCYSNKVNKYQPSNDCLDISRHNSISLENEK